MCRHALAGGELREDGAGRDDLLVVGGGDPGLAHQVVHVALLVRGLHGDDRAGLAGARGAARAVQVGLVLDGRVGVDHESDLVHVDAARGDVGADHRRRGAGAEGLEVPGAGVLREVAVQVHRVHAAGGELAGEVLRAVLGAGEHDGAAGGGREVAQHVEARLLVDLEHVVLHRAHGARRGVRGVRDRVVEELLDQLVHAGVERRGEQHPLAAARGRLEDAAHHRQEAHVGHVVGLVDHGDLDGAEIGVALAHQVQEPSGAGDEHVDAAREGVHLRVLADAAEDDGAAQAGGLLQRLQRVGDLRGELAGGGEHERARPTGCAALRGLQQARHQGQQEGVGLARAGAAPAQHVAPGQGVRQGRGLDGGGIGDPQRREGGGEGGGHAEACEVRGGHEG